MVAIIQHQIFKWGALFDVNGSQSSGP